MRRTLVALVFLLTACGEPWEGEGVVIEKQYDDQDTWYQPGYTIDGGQSCNTYNGVRTCTDNADTHIPGMWHTDPERWLLKVRDAEDKTHTASVHHATWEDCRVTQWFSTRDQECWSR